MTVSVILEPFSGGGIFSGNPGKYWVCPYPRLCRDLRQHEADLVKALNGKSKDSYCHRYIGPDSWTGWKEIRTLILGKER